MATEEWIKRAIVNKKSYEDLPPKVKAVLPLGEWKLKVKDHCISAGFGWNTSLAQAACSEGEYYEDLLRFYRHNLRLFPYHLADYVCRTMRVTPFRYYCDLLYTVMREEKSYDRIPNFTAADVVRLVGIGRNEYISIMNKCKAKKLLWRVNKSIVKEMLPTEPLEIEMQPWWIVSVVNLGETEYRQLSPAELKACERACKPGGARVADLSNDILQPLFRRGLIHLEVPIRPDDHFLIPPLEGFVSNKDSEKLEDKGDPLETVLYGVFVATSARASVAELAKILSVDQVKLQAAISIACRLGFATRLPQPGDDMASQASIDTAVRDFDLGSDPGDVSPGGSARDLTAVEAVASASASEDGAGIALVVDAEVTSYLMMGAMSPGLKRHSVTLFEGGRVTGTEVISELIRELHASVETAMMFEGDMKSIAGQFRALAAALECMRAAGGSRPLELLRKESLAGLAPAAASRVLSHAYAAVIPITPLPGPPLLLTPSRPGPTNYGPTVEAATPWLQLALYRAADCGPPSLVLVCGQRFWQLPPQLASCTHALLWPWNPEAVRAQGVPIVVEATFLLYTLNEHLSRTAVLIQPLELPADAQPADLPTLDIPLPISARASEELVSGFHPRTGEQRRIPLDGEVTDAAAALGLGQAVGCLRLLRVQGSGKQEDSRPAGPVGGAESKEKPPVTWVPLQLQLGMPLQPDALCSAVCRAAHEAHFLEADTRRRHEQGQALLQKQLFQLISEYGACSNCLAPASNSLDEPLGYVDLPIQNLMVQGALTRRLDLSEYLQGVGGLFLN